jgi:hypothetical protein
MAKENNLSHSVSLVNNLQEDDYEYYEEEEKKESSA